MLMHVRGHGLHVLVKVRLGRKALNMDIWVTKIILSAKLSKLFAEHRVVLEGEGGFEACSCSFFFLW